MSTEQGTGGNGRGQNLCHERPIVRKTRDDPNRCRERIYRADSVWRSTSSCLRILVVGVGSWLPVVPIALRWLTLIPDGSLHRAYGAARCRNLSGFRTT